MRLSVIASDDLIPFPTNQLPSESRFRVACHLSKRPVKPESTPRLVSLIAKTRSVKSYASCSCCDRSKYITDPTTTITATNSGAPTLRRRSRFARVNATEMTTQHPTTRPAMEPRGDAKKIDTKQIAPVIPEIIFIHHPPAMNFHTIAQKYPAARKA